MQFYAFDYFIQCMLHFLFICSTVGLFFLFFLGSTFLWNQNFLYHKDLI